MNHPHVLRLPYTPPYDWPAAIGFFQRRAIEGVEQVEEGVYRRTIRIGDVSGTVAVAHDQANSGLLITVRAAGDDVSDAIAGRLRRMFDLDLDPAVVADHLARDPIMAPLVSARPGLRVPGGWDGFEVAVRAIIGQQVTVVRARALLGILVRRCGAELRGSADVALRMMFPTAQQVVDGDLSAMGMPGARVTTLKSVAEASLACPGLFEPADSVEQTVARLRSIRGIGEWTAQYIALRAYREPDAFPASDVGLLRGAAEGTRCRPTPVELLQRAEAWRPWRAYAAQQLWAADPARPPAPTLG